MKPEMNEKLIGRNVFVQLGGVHSLLNGEVKEREKKRERLNCERACGRMMIPSDQFELL